MYHLKIRVPCDLADEVRGTGVTLQIGEVQASVKVGDKVMTWLPTAFLS